MARRRVFRVKVECTGIASDVSITATRLALFGRPVVFEKTATGAVALRFDGTIVGQLDDAVGSQVASALERGQVFTARIENAYQTYDSRLKPTTVRLDLKVEYSLEKNEAAIVIPKPVYESAPVPISFYTKIAGISFRQGAAAHCHEGERLLLVREPDNPKDAGAIKIIRNNGEHLGYVPAHVSRHGDKSGLSYRMDHGDEYYCKVKNVTGGNGRTLGINIEIAAGDDFTQSPLQQGFAGPPAGPSEGHHGEPRRGYGWLYFTAAAILVLTIILIAHSS